MTDIADFVNNVTSKNFVAAEKQVNAMLDAKIYDKIESMRSDIAQQVFNSGEDADEDV
jgi:hypothetical protein